MTYEIEDGILHILVLAIGHGRDCCEQRSAGVLNM